MGVPLVVILGAGASRGSGKYRREPLRPPLTIDLFDERSYGDLLKLYDLAHQAGRYITQERALDNTLGLEKALHSLGTSDHQHHRQMALAVPLYLQHLLHAVSEAHYSKAFRYDRLIERLLRLDFVCFMTLNYDVMLDRRLDALHPLNTFDDYIDSAKNWWLIKLHGSVNWFFMGSNRFDPATPTKDLAWDPEDIRCASPRSTLAEIRGSDYDGSILRYPALALPEGPDDHLVLPNKQRIYARQRLEREEIDLLVIGYSGLDKAVLSLLNEAQPTIRRLTVVNRGFDEALHVRERFREAGLTAASVDVWRGSFDDWADEGGGLNRLVEQYNDPP